MMRCLLLVLALLYSCISPKPSPYDITGIWKVRDQNSDKIRSLAAIYKYQDAYYARMLVTYDENGQVSDTILEQREKAPGVIGNPPYCGMDFVYNVKEEKRNKYKGKIVDPKEGEVYDAELWRHGKDLIVRGELWIFGKSIVWSPGSEEDLPKGFSMSDIEKFVPVIPKVE